MPYDFGDVVVVPFPFTDQTASKQRPAVVISGRTYNSSKPDIVIMAITSQLRPAAALGEVWIADWRAANLLKPSAIKPVFATLEQTLVIRRLGALAAVDQSALRAAIAAVLGTTESFGNV
jgi:mRNA interferase MazF